MHTVRLLLPDELWLRWHEIEPLLKRATDRSDCFEPIDLLRLAAAGHAGIYVAECDGLIDAAVYAAPQQYPRKRVLNVPFIGGRRMAHWHKPMIDLLDSEARRMGCACIMGFDRRGWARVGGFRENGVVLVRDL